MDAPFAALEQRVNRAVLGRLSNAKVRIGAAKDVIGIFDNDYVVAEVGAAGMSATAPAVTLRTCDLPPGCHTGASVEIEYLGGRSWWRLAEHQPDGTGLSVLLLERTA